MLKKYYKEIEDVPLFNWEMCLSGKVEYIRVEKEDIPATNHDTTAFYALHDKYIARVGLDPRQEYYLGQKRAYIGFMADYILNGNEFAFMQAQILEQRIKEQDNTPSGSLGENIIIVSKWLGYKIDKKTTSLAEYLDMVDVYTKTIEKSKDVG
jgi:hypothetical protein